MISIITVTYNSQEYINDYLKSFIPDFLKENELVIVDNASSDRTVEIIKSYDLSNLKLKENTQNLGFSKANNQGVKMSQGDKLLFINPDVKFELKSVKELAVFLNGHPEAGIVAPKIREFSGKVQPTVRNLPTISGAIKEFLLNKKKLYEAYVPSEEVPVIVESVVGAVMMINRKVFEKIQGFDERYFMYFEDLDLCRKINKLGLKVYYYPQVVFWHKVGGSVSDKKIAWAKSSEKIYHGSRAAFVLSVIYFIVRGMNFLKKH